MERNRSESIGLGSVDWYFRMAFQRKKPAAIGVKAPYPGFIEPALATSIDKVPAGERWVHEIKFDGYRVQVHLRDAVVKVFTRRGHDWTNRFKKIASDVWHIKAGSAIIDGEVVVPAAATLRSAFVSNWCELSFIRQGRLRHRSPDRAAAVKPDT